MTPPDKGVQTINPLEAKWDLAQLQHEGRLLLMKLMFQNFISNGKGVEGLANILHLIGQVYRGCK